MDPRLFTSRRAGQPILTQNGYWAFIPGSLPPSWEWSPTLVSRFAEAERELSRLSTSIAAFPFPRLLFQPFIRQEAVLSSRIEGTRASLSDLYTYEAVQLPLFETTDDIREVHNYVLALDYGLKRMKTLPISLRLIREIHSKLMDNVRGGILTPGEFRYTQNWIGPAGSTLATAPFVPPPVDEMNNALNDFENFIHGDSQIPALIRGGILHYQFEAIHPFLDGNGRVGRLLTVLLLCHWELIPQPMLNLSIYFERHRQQYYDLLLSVSQKGSWEDWLIFFLRGVSEQSQNSLLRMNRLQEVRSRYETMIQGYRSSKGLSSMLDFIFTRPIFTARQASIFLDKPFKTVQSYIERLLTLGILHEISGAARNRRYQAREIMEVFNTD